MKRKHKLEPDTRPRWDDPDLPALITLRDHTGKTWLEPFPSVKVRQYYTILHVNNDAPSWRDDPTYNMKRRK